MLTKIRGVGAGHGRAPRRPRSTWILRRLLASGRKREIQAAKDALQKMPLCRGLQLLRRGRRKISQNPVGASALEADEAFHDGPLALDPAIVEAAMII